MKKVICRKGVTLIELMVVLVIAAIGLFAVTTLLYTAYRDWFTSRQIKALQEDMDIAALTVKSILEEANEFLISDIMEDSDPEAGARINARYEDPEMNWEKEFYKSGSKLILEDIKNDKTEVVVDTLAEIYFYEYPELTNTVNVNIKVEKAGKLLENEFLVRLRN
ncbi:MAG: type II secretion system protein [Candidatus Omnitrophica bacterium]|nr:type II secretion system protein [Candidatus Omnitrophota bacterium]